MNQLERGIAFFKSDIKINIVLIVVSIFSGFGILITDNLMKPSMPVLALGLACIVWFIFGCMIITRNFVR